MLTVQNLSHAPFYNQAFEEFVFETFREDDVFLLWQNSPAVIVGSFQKGVIKSASVYGDFFSTLDAGTICGALVDCRYERSAVLEALKAHGIDGAVYRISAREMAEVIAD